MRDHVIGIVEGAVDTGIGKHDTGHAADRKQEDKTDRPDHRRFELDRAPPHRRNPRKDLDACGHRNHHRCEDEISLRINA